MPTNTLPAPIVNWGHLGADALLSKTPNQQALEEVHKGLQDVPGGSLFEMYFQAATGRNVSGGGGSGSGGLTPTQATQLATAATSSEHTDANLGGQDPSTFQDEQASAVWAYQLSGIGNIAVEQMVENAGITGFYFGNCTVQRLFPAISFLCTFTVGEDGNILVYPPGDLVNAKESARNPGETDLAMLQRILPSYSWVANFQGSDYVGAQILFPMSAVERYIFYVPPPPTLNQIFHLWDYTPTSGGPMRNGITDSMKIWAGLPVQY